MSKTHLPPGTEQGCILSPNIFTPVLVLKTRDLKWPQLEYADDMVITTDSVEEANAAIQLIKNKRAPFSLIVNENKTEIQIKLVTKNSL